MIKSKRFIKKVALVGDSAVGKTSLIRRFVVDVYDDKYIATIGAKVSKKDIEYRLADKTVYLTLMVWDILGQRDYKKIRDQGLTGSNGIIIVADLSRPETIKSVEEFWLSEVRESVPRSPMIFVGNKKDLVDEGSHTAESLDAVSKKTETPMLLCSAKTGENVQSVFTKIGQMMLADELGEKRSSEDVSNEPLVAAIDEVVSDFCEQYGDTSKAMEIVDREFKKAKVDLNAPDKDSLLMAIEYLSDVERDVHGRDISEVNKLRRWRLIDEAR